VRLRTGKPVAYYSTAGASLGLSVDAQCDGNAMFFPSDGTLKYPDQSQGFQLGVGPSVVVADDAFAKSTTTLTVKDNIYAFFFDPQGAMAAMGLRGNKIKKIKK